MFLNEMSIKKSAIIAAAIFFLAILLGILHSFLDPSAGVVLLSELQPLVEKLMVLEEWQLVLFIFLNNSVKILAAILLGTLLSIFPIFFLLLNGYLIGLIAQHFGLALVLAGIVPHGIFEIPALLLGAGAGIHLGWIVFKRRDCLKDELIQALWLFLKVIVPLLLIASLVEVFLTPHILDTMIGY